MRHYVTDALGSVIGLADDTGVMKTTYTYDPFGNTTMSGEASDNPFQYTGRENDGTGLYYYRARYYSPDLQRFISEDPIGFEGGDVNFYAYVGNNPLNNTDPEGTGPIDALMCAYYSRKISKAKQECEKEQGDDLECHSRYLDKYGPYEGLANISCICSKLGADICSKWMKSCFMIPYGTYPKIIK